MTTSNLTNINFMNKEQFDSLSEVKNDELYAVNVNDKFVTTDTTQTIVGEKKFVNDIIIKSDKDDLNITPTQDIWSHLLFHDKNGKRIGVVESCHVKDGSVLTQIGSTSKAGNTANIRIGWNTEHNYAYTYAPPCNWNNSILTTVALNSNGYVKLGNGLIIQWGSFLANNTQQWTVTLPTAFSNNAYYLNFCPTGVGDHDVSYRHGVSSKTKTSFIAYDYLGNKATAISWFGFGL